MAPQKRSWLHCFEFISSSIRKGLHSWARVARKLRSSLVFVMVFLMTIFSDFHLTHELISVGLAGSEKSCMTNCKFSITSPTSGLRNSHIHVFFKALLSKGLSVGSQRGQMAQSPRVI